MKPSAASASAMSCSVTGGGSSAGLLLGAAAYAREEWGKVRHAGPLCRILWLHRYGEGYADPAQGRPSERPRLTANRPQCIVEIPDAAEGMPEALRYEQEDERLWVGSGCIAPVPRSTREYEVSGMNVVDKWFGYRRRKPAGKRRLELDGVVARRWSPDWTTQLLDLLNVLGLLVREEPGQRELLDAICAGALVSMEELTELGVLPVAASARRPIKARPTTEGDPPQL